MTAIEFHVNQDDKLLYACRLVRKAYRLGSNTVVTAEPQLLQQLDRLLWQFSTTDFLPHCSSGSPAHTVAASPILLTGHLDACSPGAVLINLGQSVASGFERFERVIEVASSQDEDRLAARGRWKFYQQRGYALKRHEATVIEPKITEPNPTEPNITEPNITEPSAI